MQWIEVNLPWMVFDSTPELEELSEECLIIHRTLEDRYALMIGQTEGESRASCQFGEDFFKQSDIMDAISERAPEVSDDSREFTAQWLKKILKKYPDDTQVILLAKHRARMYNYQKWQLEQPDWGDYAEREKLAQENSKKRSFCYHELCRPGVEVQVRHVARDNFFDKIEEGTEKTYLIGHMSPIGELGGETSIVEGDDLVLRARVVYTPNY